MRAVFLRPRYTNQVCRVNLRCALGTVQSAAGIVGLIRDPQLTSPDIVIKEWR